MLNLHWAVVKISLSILSHHFTSALHVDIVWMVRQKAVDWGIISCSSFSDLAWVLWLDALPNTTPFLFLFFFLHQRNMALLLYLIFLTCSPWFKSITHHLLHINRSYKISLYKIFKESLFGKVWSSLALGLPLGGYLFKTAALSED